jgi:hypothetical protein
MGEPKKRGRPALSPEEKARREAERKAKKETPKSQNPWDNLSPEDKKEIARLMDIAAKADQARHQQMALPRVTEKVVGNAVHVATNREVKIDDESNGRPQFLRDDEAGWEPFLGN